MAVLVMGGTGQIGSRVVDALAREGADVAVLTQHPEEAKLPAGATARRGDELDPASVSAALHGIETLFVLSPVVADELTRTLIALRLAADAGVRGIVYFSMANADRLVDVPHAAAKFAAERLIAELDLPATILRPNYFMQNDATTQEALLDGRYAMPIGNVGAAMVDVRDIGDVAAHELLRRQRAGGPLPRDLIDVSGPEVVTADGAASIWAAALGRDVTYAGDELGAFERRMAEQMSPLMARDQALMFDWWQRIGVLPTTGAAERLTTMLGRPLRTYREFASETAREWSTRG